MARIKVSILVEDSALSRLTEIAETGKAAGLEIDDILTAVGVITGTIDESAVTQLEAVSGVAAVELQQTFQLPPSDSDVQ